MAFPPIINAADTLLTASPGTLPNVSGALLDWLQPMTFKVITKTVQRGDIIETATVYAGMGVRQPMKPQMLRMKPEGQRKWKWETFHTLPGTVLIPDDVIDFAGVRFRIMEKLDWTEYGYLEYHLVQDYLPENDSTTQDGDTLVNQDDGRIIVT